MGPNGKLYRPEYAKELLKSQKEIMKVHMVYHK